MDRRLDGSAEAKIETARVNIRLKIKFLLLL